MNHSGPQTQGALFQAVQLARVFADSKTFPDCVALAPADDIARDFRRLLDDFVRSRFALPEAGAAPVPAAGDGLAAHIDALWTTLTRAPDVSEADPPAGGTLLPLPHPYVVPGGRFREIYYWDSYFTLLGLAAAGRVDLVDSMVRNFAWLIDSVGHVPNGNRIYFLSRSQPPVFGLMLELLEGECGFDAIAGFLPQLEREYRYWMACELPAGLTPAADRHVVRLADGALLNRYWDARNLPREEAYAEDVALFAEVEPARQAEVYRNLRAAAESGWDFSSRWCGGNRSLSSIRTTELVPVDLNCLLYRVETLLARWLAQAGQARAADYAQAAVRRRAAILAHCWNEEAGWFFDYGWCDGRQTDCWSLAGVFPLFCGLADVAQAQRIARGIERHFLRPGGVVTTLAATREQWDAPNGWAPLQWATVQGLLDYGEDALAREIATRFVALADRVFRRTGKLMEKYDVCDMALDAGGGEYPVQDGFGWTNGVVRAFIARFGAPVATAVQAGAPC
ncbi:alpha,alpha-trehalase TreF [Azoarcus sp. DD4]|uniref:alpha,alpha-trehalase TreF n=1 Tax=Azoarcus sp. DD4 TaxID=2027405 RepID=UPI00197AC310|nr:alpha,alpha-trehalase TreF [Azoarcus sp. DD4]